MLGATPDANDRTAGQGISGGLRRASSMPYLSTAPAPVPGEPPIPPPAFITHATAEVPSTYHPTPPNAERSQWERIVLAPDVELHVRRPASRIKNKGIDRLVTIARELLEED